MPNVRLGNIVKKRLAKYDGDERSSIYVFNSFILIMVGISFVLRESAYLWGLAFLMPVFVFFYTTGYSRRMMYRLFLNNLEYIPKDAKKFTNKLLALRYLNGALILLYVAAFFVKGFWLYPLVMAIFAFNMWFEKYSKKIRKRMVNNYTKDKQ